MAFGACIFGCAGPELGSSERAFFADARPWGFILFSRNCETPDQVRRLASSLREAVGRDAPVLIDQEGGRVQRIGPPHWRQWLPALDQMRAAGPDGPRSMYLRYRIIAEELRDIGVNVNCAPIGDIAKPSTHSFLHDRCYGEDPKTVIAAATAAAEGLMDGGVLPVVKHMPGHGRAVADSHKIMPFVDAAADELHAYDFVAFKGLAHLPIGMTCHVVFTAIDANQPATTSDRMNHVMRNDLGFGGLLLTDDIAMEALPGSPEMRAEAALKAGCDLVLHCNGELGEMLKVADTAGGMSAAAERRAKAALAARRSPAPIDIAAAEAEISHILAGTVHG